jgi:hypothetical protein
VTNQVPTKLPTSSGRIVLPTTANAPDEITTSSNDGQSAEASSTSSPRSDKVDVSKMTTEKINVTPKPTKKSSEDSTEDLFSSKEKTKAETTDSNFVESTERVRNSTPGVTTSRVAPTTDGRYETSQTPKGSITSSESIRPYTTAEKHKSDIPSTKPTRVPTKFITATAPSISG